MSIDVVETGPTSFNLLGSRSQMLPTGAPAPYWNRYANAAIQLPAKTPAGDPNVGVGTAFQMYGKRLLEEFGIRDIWDEFAAMDDEGMSLTSVLKGLGGALWQVATMPLQAAVAPAVEINRGIGAGLLTTPNFSADKTRSAAPLKNYLTGGMTWEEQEDIYSRSAPGVYKPLTAGELRVVIYDRMIKDGWNRGVANALMLRLGTTNDNGPLSNGSYLPEAWDLRASDAGDQMDMAGVYEAQRTVSDLATELVADPLNWLAAPIAGALAARKGFTLVNDTRKIIDLAGPASQRTGMVLSGADYSGMLELDKVAKRTFHRPAGMGLWNHGRMMAALTSDEYAPLIGHIRDTTDRDELARFFRDSGMVKNYDDAHRLGTIASRLTTDDQVIHLIQAATYRNVESIRVIDDVLADSDILNGEFRAALGLQRDVFEQAALDFATEPGVLPNGHILTREADAFINSALDSDATAKAAWSKLVEPAKQTLEQIVAEQADAMHAMNRLFTPQAAKEAGVAREVGTIGGERTIEFIPRASRAEKWMKGPRTYRLSGGRLARYNPRIILMDKPGLSFTLHGQDAIDKFNDMINWVDARITGQKFYRAFGNGARFTPEADEELGVLHRAFLDAGLRTDMPEELRAKIMDDFQTLVLRRMAEATGFDPDIAKVLAARGMDRGRKLIESLTDAQRGYTTALVEDGRAQMLKTQPAVERQTANYVPLMDWDAAFKAMYAVRRGENAMGTDPAQIISAARAEAEYFGSGSRYRNRPLKYVGRERTWVGRSAHTVLDIADAVNHIFKVAVLLRLGYPVRNLAEGFLSIQASGTSTLDLARHLDVGGLMQNAMYNAARIPRRMIDRVAVATGRRMNDDALLQYADALAEVDNLTQDRVQSLIAVIGSDERRAELARIAQDTQKFTPEQNQAARDALVWLTEMDNRLALAVTADNIATGGPFRSHASMHAAQHLYHGDTSGSVSAGRGYDSEGVLALDQELDRPIRLVDNPHVAHGNVDKQWQVVPVTGRNATDRANALAANARAVGGGSKFRYTDANGVTRTTSKPKTVLSRADTSQPVFVHRVRNGKLIGPGKQVAIPPPTIQTAAKGRAGTHHLQMRDGPNGLWRPYSARTATSTSELRILDMATHPDGFPKVVSVDTWGAELDLRDVNGVRHALATYRDVDQPLLDAAKNGDRAAQDRLSEIMAGHGVYRVVLPDSRAAGWGRYQILVHPNGVGRRGLRDAVDRQVNDHIEAAARARASERELRVRRGRKGDVRSIGGLKADRIRSLNKQRPERTTKEKHWLVGEPLVPNRSLDAVEVLQNGGFEPMVDELVEAAIRTRRNRYTAQALYQQRVQRMNANAKRRGIRDTANLFVMRGAYGADHILPSLLAGGDGAMFGTLASGEATYMMGYAQMGYLADAQADLARAYMNPTPVTPDDPRYFDALANLFARQYRDQPGFLAGGRDNLDPVVRRLLEPGDRQRLIDETIDWALNTEDGARWVRTIGLDVLPGERVSLERTAAAARQQQRAPKPPARTRAERRGYVETNWRQPGNRAAMKVNVGDAVTTMSNFLENWVLVSPQAADLLMRGNVTADALRAAHRANPWELRPVSGMLSPTTAEARNLLAQQRAEMKGMEELNHKIVNGLAKAMRSIGPVPETRFLRHPMFEAVGQADLRQRIAFSEATLGRDLTIDEVNDLRAKSQRYALKKMEQTLYTLHGRGAVDDYLRFISPFFPAWKNAITRWGRFVRETPGHVALLTNRIQRIGGALPMINSNGEEVTFENAIVDETYVVMPGIGGLVEKVAGVKGAREAMSKTYFPLRSMDVVFQGEMLSPGSGPWIAAPLQWLLTNHADWLKNDVVKFIADKVFPVGPTNSGEAGLDYLQTFMPSGVRRAVDMWLKPDAWAQEQGRNMRLLQTLMMEGEIEPMSADRLLSEATRLTQWKMGVKVASAFASPIASQQRGETEQYAAIWRQLRDAYGDTRMADDQFEILFPTKYRLAQSSSKNITGGASTAEAFANQKRYGLLQQWAASTDTTSLLGFVENYDDDAFLTGEMSEGYTQDDYNTFARRWQMLNAPEGSPDNFRRAMTGEESLLASEVKDGYRLYDQTRALIEAELVQKGLSPGSYEFVKQINDRMAFVGDEIGRTNPAWEQEHGKRDEERLMRNEMFFRQVLNERSMGFITPEREEHALVKSMRYYLDTRDALRNALLQNRLANPDAATRSDAVANELVHADLYRVREALSAGSPAFRQWVDRYFRNDLLYIDKADLMEAS